MDIKMLTGMLEKAIDENGLENVVSWLAVICSQKATHVEENYPKDKLLIAQWDKAHVVLGRAEIAINKIFKPA